MARIMYINKDNATQEVAEIFAKMEAHGADVLNLWKIAAHSPSMLTHLVRMGSAILTKTELAPKLREMSIIRVAEILDCAYEKKAHILFAKDVGITSEQVMHIKDWESSIVYSAAERATLRFTDELTKKGKAARATFSKLERYLSHKEMMELTITIGYYGMLARLLLTFEVDIEDNMLTSSQIIGHSSG